MDGRESMALSGSSSYYFHRGISGSGHASGSGIRSGFQDPPGFKPETNPNFSVQPNVRENSSLASTFQLQSSSPSFPHGFNMGGGSSGVPMGETIKKKRGRPRKYGPDGTNMALGVSPMSAPPPSGSGSMSPSPKKGRGRPRGSGWKQKLALLEAEVTRPPPPPPPPPPPAVVGHADEIPVDVSSEDEDKKPNINDHLAGLQPPPRVRRNASTIFLDKPLRLIADAKSHLASELLALRNSEIKTMVRLANRVFSVLKNYGDDYLSFYRTVRRFIKLRQELSVYDTLRNKHCAVFEEVSERYEELVIAANSAEEELSSANMALEEAEKNVFHQRKILEESRSVLSKGEMELKQDESKLVARKSVGMFIKLSQELSVADTLRNKHCAVFEEVLKRYEEFVNAANNAEEESSANMTLEESEKNVVRRRKRLEKLRRLLIKGEMELKQDESKLVARKSEVDRCSEIHSSLEVQVQSVGLEEEEAKKVFDEAKKRCEEASKDIAHAKEELRSFMGMP